MLERWYEAQKAEKLFWSSEGAVHGETAKVLRRYSEVFSGINSDKDWKILDVGCGPTVVSRLIKGGEKYGLDPLMNYFVGKIRDKAMLTCFHFLRGVGEFLPFKSGCFDLVVCRNVLDHVAVPEMVSREIARVCRGEGLVLLVINVYSPFIVRIKRFVEKFRVPFLKEEHHPNFFTCDEFLTLVSENGDILKRNMIFEDKQKARNLVEAYIKRKRKVTFRSIVSSIVFCFFWKMMSFLNGVKSAYYSAELSVVASTFHD